MARGSSQSQLASVVSKGGAMGATPRDNVTTTASLRRRRTTGGNSSGSGGRGFVGSGGRSNMLRFYIDDAPILNITPTVVLVMSFCFIGLVTTLHVIGKLYRYRPGGS